MNIIITEDNTIQHPTTNITLQRVYRPCCSLYLHGNTQMKTPTLSSYTSITLCSGAMTPVIVRRNQGIHLSKKMNLLITFIVYFYFIFISCFSRARYGDHNTYISRCLTLCNTCPACLYQFTAHCECFCFLT